MEGHDVFLNVYRLNGSPELCAPCGLYHTSVQIGELEYSFGDGAGVTCSTMNPRLGGVHAFPDGTYEYSLHRGKCTLSSAQLSSVIASLQRAFPGHSYDLISKNCNHFSDALLKATVGKGIPSYINRASRYGQWLSCLVPDGWRAGAEGEAEEIPPQPAGVRGIFEGSGQRLGGRDNTSVCGGGFRIWGDVLRLGDCLRPPEAPTDDFETVGAQNNRLLLAQAAEDRLQRQLSQRVSSIY